VDLSKLSKKDLIHDRVGREKLKSKVVGCQYLVQRRVGNLKGSAGKKKGEGVKKLERRISLCKNAQRKEWAPKKRDVRQKKKITGGGERKRKNPPGTRKGTREKGNKKWGKRGRSCEKKEKRDITEDEGRRHYKTLTKKRS